MNLIDITLVVAAIWLVYLSAITTSAVALRDQGDHQLVEPIAADGVFVATAASLVAVALMR